jgi:hypothetical protein
MKSSVARRTSPIILPEGTTVLSSAPGAFAPEQATLPGPKWFVKVSGAYVSKTGWLVGDPRKAELFDTPDEAWQRVHFIRERRLWLGRVYVVRRTTLRVPAW